MEEFFTCIYWSKMLSLNVLHRYLLLSYTGQILWKLYKKSIKVICFLNVTICQLNNSFTHSSVYLTKEEEAGLTSDWAPFLTANVSQFYVIWKKTKKMCTAAIIQFALRAKRGDWWVGEATNSLCMKFWLVMFKFLLRLIFFFGLFQISSNLCAVISPCIPHVN